MRRHELTLLIRFALDQMRIQNAHHRFEDLCYDLARSRICSNVIPSTGPVAGGGDQGRDFETFRTYLGSSFPDTSTFVGLVAPDPVVFACTTQENSAKNPLSKKIRSDVSKVMAHGIPVPGVTYFSVQEIKSSDRNKLKGWAFEKFGILLDIIDGATISKLLNDPEVFWIAQAHLDLPSEVALPRVGVQWYEDLYSAWKSREAPPSTFADFVSIKQGLRHAGDDPALKSDMSFWLQKMSDLLAAEPPARLKRKATYEALVGSLLLRETFRGQESMLRTYFSDIEVSDPLSDIEDACSLLAYAGGARLRCQVDISRAEFLEIARRLRLIIKSRLIQASDRPAEWCSLMESRAYLALTRLIILGRSDFSRLVRQTLKIWRDVVVRARESSVYPIDRFHDRALKLAKLIPNLSSAPLYDTVCSEAEGLIARRLGAATAAHRCSMRAIDHFQNGRTLRAIRLLHDAKINWFTSGVQRQTILSLLLISQWYSRLRLNFAAKYYAAAAAYISHLSDDDAIRSLLSRSLSLLADASYSQGNWIDFIEYVDLAQIAHANLVGQQDEDFVRMVFHTSVVERFSEWLAEPHSTWVAARIRKLPTSDWYDDLAPISMKHFPSLDNAWSSAQLDLCDHPYCDASESRQLRWSELGLYFTLVCRNALAETRAAEEFAALLQIVLADLADSDLCIPRTDIKLQITVEDVDSPTVDWEPSNDGTSGIVVFPTMPYRGDLRPQDIVLTSVFMVLRRVSLLPESRLMSIIEDRFRDGLPSKTMVAMPYQRLYDEFMLAERFEVQTFDVNFPPFDLKEHHELAWRDSIGPGYSDAEGAITSILRSRYETSKRVIRSTLPRLLTYSRFLDAVKALRSEGWLDWHILMATATVAMNSRIAGDPRSRTDIAYASELGRLLMEEGELPGLPLLDPAAFSYERLAMQVDLNMLSTIKSLGLECRQETPNLPAIREFLDRRYRFRIDDIEHEDPFAGI